jgi:hypothetical protein
MLGVGARHDRLLSRGLPERIAVGKRHHHAQRIRRLLGDPPALARLLLGESGLPGPHANLELAAAVADVVAELGPERSPCELLFEWVSLPAGDAPTNHPREFLPCCAVQALGALFVDAGAELRERVAAALLRAAQDDRWRVREAAAIGLQRMGERDLEPFAALVEPWARAPSDRLRRAAVVALAHPPLLGDPAFAQRALALVDQVLRDLATAQGSARRSPANDDLPDAEPWDEEPPPRPGRKRARATELAGGEAARQLLRALEFAPSVLVAAAPEAGFAMLRRWAGSRDRLVQRLVVANVRKSRLARRFPEQIEEVGEVLAASAE